jgi:hypothetical protein
MVAGQAYFRTREPLRARTSLAAWNLFLALFSLVGMLRTFPQLVHNLATLTLRENLCANPQATYGSGSTGLWVQLFILSKFPYVSFCQTCVGRWWTHIYTYTHTQILTLAGLYTPFQ